MSRPAFVSISGGIGVGKTTLTSQLAGLVPDCQAFIEYPGRNPYLADFYADMHRWAFHSRVGMLALFASRYKEFDFTKEVILMDRSLHENITFANLHVDRGYLSAREFAVYQMLYDVFVALARPLDVVVYLTCSPSVALQRIKQRDRKFEREVSEEYLAAVENCYEQWLAALPSTAILLKYNTDEGVQATTVLKDIQGCLSK